MTVSPTPPIKDVTSLTQQQAALTLRQKTPDQTPVSHWPYCTTPRLGNSELNNTHRQTFRKKSVVKK